MAPDLTPERGLLFRITHKANLPWLLRHGLHCANGNATDPDFVAIGNADLIGSRARHRVPMSPGGTLANYVPFYFTPKSPMLYNIRTGYKGVTLRQNEEIIILVSSCQAMHDRGVTLLFTDRHAFSATATWTDKHADLATTLDWDILRRHDFARDERYPDKMERYQAEALAHRHVPSGALLGIGCVSESERLRLLATVAAAGLATRVVVRQEWYFQ